MRITILSLLLACAFLSGGLAAGEGVTSESGLDFGDLEVAGFTIVPAPDVSAPRMDGDYALPMVFEIKRPGMRSFSVARILSSCACLSIRTFKRDFADGERAFLELRNVKPTVENGAVYAFFVQLSAPERLSVRYDVFVNSDRR